MKAFRVPSARAAWKYFIEGDKKRALEHYESAILEDSENGWLFDRYAYTLFTLKRYEEANVMSKRAVMLLPSDGEAWFTKGIIESRMGLKTLALKDLDKAASYGKEKHLCELQKAYAYVYASPTQKEEARTCFRLAQRLAPKDKFFDRFITEAISFQRRWLT